MKPRRITSLLLGLGLCVLVLAACSSTITRTTSPDSVGMDPTDCCAQKNAAKSECTKKPADCKKDAADCEKGNECCKKKAKAAKA